MLNIYQCGWSFHKDEKAKTIYEHHSDFQPCLTYFTFTTFSTVGFGDLHPCSNYERLAFYPFVLVGLCVFSYIVNELQEIMYIMTADEEEDNKREMLRFFKVIKHFNNFKDCPKEVREKIEEYFNLKWEFDKNLAVSSGYHFLRELPQVVCQRLYTQYLFANFI